MKLEKFQEKNNKKKFIVLFTVCCIFLLAGVFLYTSFAVFTEEKQFNVINGQYQDPGDLYYAVYIDGEITNTFPNKNSGYTLDTEKSSCTNGVTISFDYNNWTIQTNFNNYTNTDNSRVKCRLYFKKRTFAEAVVDCGVLGKDAGTCIKENNYLTKEVVSDETIDNNLRFIGADPNNYVSFNNELWRIIGVMNNIDNGSGTKETRLKIIRYEPIGKYSWDNKASGTGSSTSVYGSNDWSDSALQMVLNSGAYWNRTSGECPGSADHSGGANRTSGLRLYAGNGFTRPCDFSSNGLTNEAKAMIGNAVWNLGGSNGSKLTASLFYEKERGTGVYSGRPTTWTGQIGLMYPSDYGYATSGGNTTDRNTCLANELYNWDSLSDCYNNDWLYDTSNDQWTSTPDSRYSTSVFVAGSSGYLSDDYASNANRTVSPALYLSSNVKISGGTGSSSDPYQLSL